MKIFRSKNFTKILLIILGVIFLSLLWLLKVSISDKNYWTAITTITTILVTIGIALLQMYEANKQKNKEKEERIVEKFNEKVATTRERAVDPLVETYEKVKNNHSPLNLSLNDPLFKNLVEIFYRYKAVDKYRNIINGDGSNKEDLLNQKLLVEFINDDNFQEVKKKIKENFPELKGVIKTISNFSDKNKSTDGNSAHNYILGDWVINRKNAEKVKILIGLSMDKKIISIYLIDEAKYLDESNRIRFKEKAILYDYEFKKNSEIEHFNDFFEDWTAQNPVMYLNTWSKKTSEEKRQFRNAIEGLIEKENISIPNISSDHTILAVKTYKEYEFKEE